MFGSDASELSFKANAYLVFMGQLVTEGSGIDLFNRSALKWGQGGPEDHPIIDLVDRQA